MKNKLKVYLLQNKFYIANFLVMTFILSIILLGFYPGIMTYDSVVQWKEVQSGIITNTHPFFSTYFMYLLSKIYNSPFIICIYQILIFSLIWSYFCKLIKGTKNQNIFTIIYTAFIAFIPIISIYNITLWKDILYTSYLFLIGILLFKLSCSDFKISKANYILLGILLSLIYSYRINGKIVSVIILAILLIILIKRLKSKIDKNKKEEIKNFLIIFGTYIICVLCLLIVSKIVVVKQDNNDQNLSTINSYSLWIMSTHIKDNNIKNEDDITFLNNIIPIDEWKNVYDPYIINSVTLAPDLNKKYLMKNETEFRNLFLITSVKHPISIAKHYVKSDGLLINPITLKKGYVYVFSVGDMLSGDKIYPKINFINKNYIKLIELLDNYPFKALYQPALIMYLTFALSLLLMRIYGKKIFMLLLPMISNIISLLPINLAQDLRYVYINYITFFGVLLMFILNYNKIFYKKHIKKA